MYPNPAQGEEVTVSFFVNEKSTMRLEVYTTAYRKVLSLSLGERTRGSHLEVLPLRDAYGKRLSNGLYYVVLRSIDRRLIGKMIVLR